MTRLCLDTSAYSQFKRGEPSAVDLIDAASWIGVPAIVLGELRVGFEGGRRGQANERELAAFVANPVVRILDIDDDAARIYSDIVLSLKRAGTPVPTNDIWIAAVAAREGASIATFDAHFHSIARVGTILLPSS